jgi:hypothetical protein
MLVDQTFDPTNVDADRVSARLLTAVKTYERTALAYQAWNECNRQGVGPRVRENVEASVGKALADPPFEWSNIAQTTEEHCVLDLAVKKFADDYQLKLNPNQRIKIAFEQALLQKTVEEAKRIVTAAITVNE